MSCQTSAPQGIFPWLRADRATRAQIHAKTDGRCHFCGCNVSVGAFEANHVKNHASGGGSCAESFLPACKICNNYRWHYSHEELQWILKIGVWVSHNIVKRTKLGSLIANAFITKEVRAAPCFLHRDGCRRPPTKLASYCNRRGMALAAR